MFQLTLFNKITTSQTQRIFLSISLPCLLFYLMCLSSLFFSNIAQAEKSYIKCWKNAKGQTECGNRIPREFYNQRIRYIDDKGITRKVKGRVKTGEELKAQKEMDKLLFLEAEQERKSNNYDLVLLKTYLTIDDLLTSLNSKLSIINSRSNIMQSSIESKKRQFSNLVRQAADMERSGKKISEKLASQLSNVRNELKNLQAQLTTEEQRTEQIKQTFAHDVERFIISKSQRIQYSMSSPGQAKKLRAVKLNCLNKNQCDSQWKKANDFIEEFSTGDILYKTANIAVSDIPVDYQDIGMALSLIDTENSEDKKMLIFQIRCNRKRKGQEFCDGEEVNNLLKDFKNAVYN